MKAVYVSTPPLVSVFDDKLCVELVFDAPDGEKYFVRAPIGDGSYFASMVMERVIAPALKREAARQRKAGAEAGRGGDG